MSMPSWTVMGQGWQAHAFMISTARWGVALNAGAMVWFRLRSRCGFGGLEVVGADLLTVFLGLAFVKEVFGLLG